MRVRRPANISLRPFSLSFGEAHLRGVEIGGGGGAGDAQAVAWGSQSAQAFTAARVQSVGAVEPDVDVVESPSLYRDAGIVRGKAGPDRFAERRAAMIALAVSRTPHTTGLGAFHESEREYGARFDSLGVLCAAETTLGICKFLNREARPGTSRNKGRCLARRGSLFRETSSWLRESSGLASRDESFSARDNPLRQSRLNRRRSPVNF